MFAAVSTSLWDNGAACGRKYMVRCLSGTGNRPCKPGNIAVQVVDKCRQDPCRATFLLSRGAFNSVSRSPTSKLNIEFIEYDDLLFFHIWLFLLNYHIIYFISCIHVNFYSVWEIAIKRGDLVTDFFTSLYRKVLTRRLDVYRLRKHAVARSITGTCADLYNS
jgi:Lytic transglycolase